MRVVFVKISEFASTAHTHTPALLNIALLYFKYISAESPKIVRDLLLDHTVFISNGIQRKMMMNSIFVLCNCHGEHDKYIPFECLWVLKLNFNFSPSLSSWKY